MAEPARSDRASSAPLYADVGWRNLSPQAALAFFPPEPLGGDELAALQALHPEAAGVSDLEHRILQVRCPYNLRVRVSPPHIRPTRFTRIEEEGGLSEAGWQGLCDPIVPSAQRARAVPALQISLNLQLVTEEHCTLNLMPPFFAPSYRDWPGPLVSGRFPLRSWPRPLNAVLEWQDHERDWVLRRGDPMVYLWVQFDDPRKRPRVVEAALTPALKRHFAQVDDVGSYGRNVGPMFQEAERRRPARLLTPKRIGCPAPSSTRSPTS